ncbi:hypothetical protein B0O99DRAFT_552441 [Bisporella sp. PMI_857]|nr:hypothetical protein B0O99DRAFT_552441 [Bisporella sp. PMI_857]
MPGRIRQWPAWGEYGPAPGKDIEDPEFLRAKRDIIEKYGADSLRQSWISVCNELGRVTDDIASHGSATIPILTADHIIEKGFMPHEISAIKRTGCCIIRGVIPETEASQLYQDLKQYVTDNKPHITGWPKESPAMLMLYDSPTQNIIRTHPRQLRLQRILNEFWHDETRKTSPDPLVYYDGIRDRVPGQPFLGLGPHVDAGSLCRWADASYRKVYDKIFSGSALEHDAWDLGVRKDAVQDLFQGEAHSKVFRSFQGWTALTRTAPNEGTLLLYPNVSVVVAYMLLRPFFRPPADKSLIMDPTTWTLDESDYFPGTFKPHSQRLSRSSHPHLRLEECLVHIPKMQAGDTVWWHCDVCHAVDPNHEGTENASVAYVAACPTTQINTEYVKAQLQAISSGQAPPDFHPGSGSDERMFKGYKGHRDLSMEARKAYGYDQ